MSEIFNFQLFFCFCFLLVCWIISLLQFLWFTKSFLSLHGEWPGMSSKIFNYKLSWLIGKMSLCGQVDKRVDSRSRGRNSSSDE